MRLTVNGEQREFENSRTVTDLLRELDITGTHIAVAVNLQVIPRADYDSWALNPEDKVEIVHAVGGGCGAASGG